jgi:hypothetical protein
LKDGSQPMELVESSMVEPVGLKVSMVGAVELSCQEKLRQRSLRERILEVQVDYFFLGLVESKFKIILLRQVFSGCFLDCRCPIGPWQQSTPQPVAPFHSQQLNPDRVEIDLHVCSEQQGTI